MHLEAELRGVDGELDQKPVTVADLSPPDLALVTPVANQLLGANFTVLAAAGPHVSHRRAKMHAS